MQKVTSRSVRISSLVGGEANRRRPAEAQDGDHRAQLDHLLAQREEPEPGPVGLGLETRSGLETNLRVLDLGRPEQAEVALKGRVAASVAVLVPELGMQVGAPDAGQTLRRRSMWIRWVSLSSVGLARPELRGPELASSL
jgi:hypothetical protein